MDIQKFKEFIWLKKEVDKFGKKAKVWIVKARYQNIQPKLVLKFKW